MTSIVSDEGRTCITCKEFQPWENFSRDNRRLSGRRSRCRKCVKISHAEYHANQRRPRLSAEYTLAKSLRVTVLSVDEFIAHNEASGGRCNVCGEEPRSGKRLAVDHDHTTGEFRGLLCVRCNTALGLVDDNIERLQALINYLTNPPLSASAAIARSCASARRG